MKKTIEIGKKVRDKISGLEGIAIARAEWLYGCVRFCVQPQELKDGEPVDSTWFDEPQLEYVTREVKKTVPSGGGPRRADDSR